MEISEQRLRDNYGSMSTDQLIELRERGTLTEVATRIIEQVLSDRNIAPDERAKLMADVQQQILNQSAELQLLASYGSRFAGRVLDNLFGICIAVVGAVVVLTVQVVTGSQQITVVSGIFFASLLIGYWLLGDAMPNGQNLGKRVVGTSVVHAITMQPCTVSQSFLRNFFRFIIGPFDLITFTGPKRQRIGDLLAKTIVINKTESVDIKQPDSLDSN